MTHIDPATPAVDPVELIARTLDAVALDAVTNRSTPSATVLRSVAGDLLDELLADDEPEPTPAWARVTRPDDGARLVERDTDAVRIVEHILATHAHPRPIAEAIVEALFGIPTVTRHDDGARLVIDWHDTPTHRPRACIVARDLLDDIVELLERAAAPAAEPEYRPDYALAAVAPLSPDCKAGKCHACTGDAWSVGVDARADCAHPCHTQRMHPEGGLVPTGESGVSKSPDGTR